MTLKVSEEFWARGDIALAAVLETDEARRREEAKARSKETNQEAYCEDEDQMTAGGAVSSSTILDMFKKKANKLYCWIKV